MGWVLGVVTGVLVVVFLWGLIAPRSMWRSLVAWSVSDTYRNEPGGAAYGMRRVVSGVGLVAVLGITGVAVAGAAARAPGEPPAPSSLELMWGDVAPRVVNRIVVPVGEAPAGLVEVPIDAYQDFDDGIPSYVSLLPGFDLLGDDNVSGYVGTIPPIGNGALDFADLVVNVRGPLLCVPRAVVMFQTEESISIGVFYGLPTAEDGTETGDSVAGCPLDSPVTGSILIPLQLTEPVGDREVLSLDGSPIAEVPVID